MKYRLKRCNTNTFRRHWRTVLCGALAGFAIMLCVLPAFGEIPLLIPADENFSAETLKKPVFSDRADRVLPPNIRLVSDETAVDPWLQTPPASPPTTFAELDTNVPPYHAFAPQQFPPQQIPQPFNPYLGYADPYSAGMSPFGMIAEPYQPYQPTAEYQPMPDYNTLAYNTAAYNNTPDYNAVYQALLMQEIARRQAETSPEARGKEPKTAEEKQKAAADAAADAANKAWTMDRLMPVRVSSPLGETLVACAKTVSPFCSPAGPDKGVGNPLVGKSWLDRPYYFGGFVGTTSGSQLVADLIDQKNGGHGGFLFGYNFNDYWGVESRLHFSAIGIVDTARGKQIYEEQYKAAYGADAQVPPLTSRTNELTILDAAVHYYPLGNAKWRPYFKYGLGIGHESYETFSRKIAADVVAMPMGAGLRYWWNERIAFQMDLTDNVIFASGMTKTQNNVSFSLGLTYSFGSGSKSRPVYYWPATPSMGSKW